MTQEVLLSIRGCQTYPGQAPETIELVTDGVLEEQGGGWNLSYQESDITGLEGVTTTFRVEPGKIILNREGRLRSQMVFQEGMLHESLYQMEFGTLMMAVSAKKVAYDITPSGGTLDLQYAIEIEQSMAGMVDYHLDIKVKN